MNPWMIKGTNKNFLFNKKVQKFFNTLKPLPTKGLRILSTLLSSSKAHCSFLFTNNNPYLCSINQSPVNCCELYNTSYSISVTASFMRDNAPFGSTYRN